MTNKKDDDILPAKKEAYINTIDFLEIKDVKSDILITKDKYIKILKVLPINYDLKSDFEKQSILNSYKTVLKTCNFNFQILILSEKEDINIMINKLNDIQFIKVNELDKIKFLNSEKEKEILKKKEVLSNIYFEYVKYINKLNYDENITSKSFYIILSEEKLKEENLLNKFNLRRKKKSNKSNESNVNKESIENRDSLVLQKRNNLKQDYLNKIKILNDKENKLRRSINRCGNSIKVLKDEEIYSLFDFSKRRQDV